MELDSLFTSLVLDALYLSYLTWDMGHSLVIFDDEQTPKQENYEQKDLHSNDRADSDLGSAA